MAFQTISYKHTNTCTDIKLHDLLELKFSSLEKYIGGETDVRLEVKFEKESPHRNGRIFCIEANLWLKGTLYHTDASCESFEKAIDEVRDGLDKELRRSNKKRTNRFLKGARKIKDMMHTPKK